MPIPERSGKTIRSVQSFLNQQREATNAVKRQNEQTGQSPSPDTAFRDRVLWEWFVNYVPEGYATSFTENNADSLGTTNPELDSHANLSELPYSLREQFNRIWEKTTTRFRTFRRSINWKFPFLNERS